MLKLKIQVQDEDKFELVLQLLSQQLHKELYKIEPLHKELYKIEPLDIESDKNNIYFLLEYAHSKFINRILIKIKDLIEIIEFNIEYAYIYSREEAYTDIDNQTNRNIIYNNLKY
jgi:hypothetical protein